jgi:hypothetical protein
MTGSRPHQTGALLAIVACLLAAPRPVSAAESVLTRAASAEGMEYAPFLPWPPPVPAPWPPGPPPGTPPFLPPLGPAGTGVWPDPLETATPDELATAIASLQQTIDLLGRWAANVQHAASTLISRMIWESPGSLPQGTELPDVVGRITQVPVELGATLDTVIARLQAAVLPGSADARHRAYIESSPSLTREQAGIATADTVITSSVVQQEAATRATTEAATAAAHDAGLPSTISAGHDTGDTLLASARSVPSTRAGIELLIGGMGAGMRQQADLGAAVADRLTLLTQQTAQVSRQIGALAATTATVAARETERDRRAVDARLGLADALTAGGQMLHQMLSGAGESGDEIRIDPLYH